MSQSTYKDPKARSDTVLQFPNSPQFPSSRPQRNPVHPGAINSAVSFLTRSEANIVKTRTGSVLSRGMILKSDHYPSGRALQLDITLQGAPNFRAPKQGKLNILGVAQPRLQGLKSILSVLGCRPDCVYISGRPYVLRDASEPRKNLALSDRAESLEGIEQRLRNDILQEASRYGGLILTHLEIETDSDSGAIVPTWTAVESGNVFTLSELWKELSRGGWNIQVIITIYAYVRVLLTAEANPENSSLLFSCGMGAVRTTFAMCAASIVRRRQLMLQGFMDPYELSPFSGPLNAYSMDDTRCSTPPGVQAAMTIGNINANQDFSKSLLRLTSILQYCLRKGRSNTATEWLLSHPSVTDNLRKASNGSYGIILSLLGCLDNGLAIKRLVDKIIDSCDHVINLREDILVNRIQYSLTTLEDKSREVFLEKAAKALEKYFFLIAFASYVEGQKDFNETFEEWLKARVEIWNQVTFLRKTRGSRLNIFAPISDLSSLAKSESEGDIFEAGPKNDVAVTGGQILGDEWTTHVVEFWYSTLLKSDQWLTESDPTEAGIRGAINFRNIPGTNIYALGQPSQDAILTVVERVKYDHPQASEVIWITLREEPLNIDFNTKSLSERLKGDVISELNTFGGYLLLHTETREGAVIPVWENVQVKDVCVVKDIMLRHKHVQNIELHYRRIPITSELTPDFNDFAELMDVVVQAGRDTPIVINCQLGRGRSTLASIILSMVRHWLDIPSTIHSNLPTPLGMLPSFLSDAPESIRDKDIKRYSYKAINHILRVVRHGLEVKVTVDTIIDHCSKYFNLRESIEEAATNAEETSDPQQKQRYIEKGMFFLSPSSLLLFQAYLVSNPPDTLRTLETFESFVRSRPVFQTFEHEMHTDGIHALKPLEQIELSQGLALSDEVKQVVSNRSGNVLSASTILKSDFFSNLQKLSLPDLKNVLSRVNAGPNGINKVNWVSLREEPVLYVAGRPHVLRLLDRPLENVESTGITTVVVEQIEKRLKIDVIRELRGKGGKLLLHDEMETEPGTFEIVPQWEEVAEADILTPRETDERAPLPSALDQLLNVVKPDINGEDDFVFNCQMGRGRTTTGMVAACLISTILAQEVSPSLLSRQLQSENTDSLMSSELSVEELYTQGEYKVILQLVGVLSFGKAAKRITDLAVDRMQDVQNLRKTIYDYKLKADACVPGTTKHTKLQQIALNYLYRYATLIVFANYLVEIHDVKVEIAFPTWLNEHREITQLLSRGSLD
ncbi:hypothetical protein Clacol_002580 [Clathrus columnatus]|uniref:Paladin n=1 Tax=Clathrus columnatus TaxID=1419009 RepID=A0AAV5A5T0_9AGAM|nr:hypothetical protein Clacol_002580 [Clathrus columnatus]